MATIVSNEFAQHVRNALAFGGLSRDPISVVGRTFQFGSEFDGHHAIVVGNITGIEISDLDNMMLRVSCPRFWGQEIDALFFSEKSGWVMRTVRHRRIVSETERVTLPRNEFPGELSLL